MRDSVSVHDSDMEVGHRVQDGEQMPREGSETCPQVPGRGSEASGRGCLSLFMTALVCVCSRVEGCLCHPDVSGSECRETGTHFHRMFVRHRVTSEQCTLLLLQCAFSSGCAGTF